MRKLSHLEALRGYAILGVVFTHVSQKLDGLPGILHNIGIQGARGVQLFFIVSAFAMFYSYHKRKKETSFDLGGFFVRRFFRIAPMFYCALLFYTVFDILTYSFGFKDFHNEYSIGLFISTLTFTSILNPEWLYSLVPGGWSISAEFLFYCLVPVLFIFIKDVKRAFCLILFTIGIGWILNVIMIRGGWISIEHIDENYLFYWFPSQIPIFLIGIMLYFIWKLNIKMSNFQNLMLLIGSIVCLVFLAVTGNIYNPLFPKHILFSIAFMGIGWSLGNIPYKFIVNKLMNFIGEVSFSIYLIHFFVLDILETIYLEKLTLYMNNIVALFILYIFTLSISLGLSYLTYRFIEIPGIRLGKRIIKYKHKSITNAA